MLAKIVLDELEKRAKAAKIGHYDCEGESERPMLIMSDTVLALIRIARASKALSAEWTTGNEMAELEEALRSVE